MLRPRLTLALALLLAPALSSAPARAQPSAAQRDAATHFQRGVSLYNDGDFQGALVEFKRAFAIAPNPAVLYNIGQTQFQLQNYAAALGSLESYLEQSPSPSHRAEVLATLDQLRGRVGKLDIKGNVSGAEVSVDDQPVGALPLQKPVLVNVGRRRVSASAPGRAPVAVQIEVPSGETVEVTLQFHEATPAPASAPPAAPSAGPSAAPAPASSAPPVSATPPPGPAPSPRAASPYATPLWVTTGVLASGTAVLGVLALSASRTATHLRDDFPVTPEEQSAAQGRVKTLALLTDVVGAAAVAAGGLALWATLSRGEAGQGSVQVGLAPSRASLRVRF